MATHNHMERVSQIISTRYAIHFSKQIHQNETKEKDDEQHRRFLRYFELIFNGVKSRTVP